MIWRKVHTTFRLNGFAYTSEELREAAYTLIKEGEPFEQDMGSFLLDWLDNSETLKVQTSGSTGTPKTMLLKKEHMVRSAQATGAFFGLSAGATALHCLPCKYIAGKMMLVRAMVLGWQLYYVPPTGYPLQNTMKTYDFCAMVPLQVGNSLSLLDNLKQVLAGGAPMDAKLKEALQSKKTEVFEGYGMTETITHIALKKINHLSGENGRQDSFKALPEVTFKTDARGCLVIRAPHILDRDMITNDVVQLVSETEFHWLGRYDNIINSGSIKWIPEQIEAKLRPHLASRFFVAGRPDPKLGQKLVLMVEGTMNTTEIWGQLEASSILAKHERPKEIKIVPKFLETPNGKVRRAATLQNYFKD